MTRHDKQVMGYAQSNAYFFFLLDAFFLLLRTAFM